MAPGKLSESGRKRRNGAGGQASSRSGGRGGPLDMGLMPDLLSYNLRCAQVVVFQHFNATFAPHDISAPQFGTLLLIEANPGLSQSSVAEALRFDRSTLVQIVDRLEGRGLVVREVSSRDRRSYALRLTPDGAALLATLKELVAEHEKHTTRNLTAGDRETLIRLLDKVHSPRRG